MIGVDWGTTSFRAFRIARTARSAIAELRGLLNVPDNRFADTLREEVGPGLPLARTTCCCSHDRQPPRLDEAPYLLPAGAARLPASWRSSSTGVSRVVPGLSATDDAEDKAGVRRAGGDGRQRAHACRGRTRNGCGSRTAGSSVSPRT
jgi:2-dehydro-3-deoxygalactonokinase